jgi:hypothetical protein
MRKWKASRLNCSFNIRHHTDSPSQKELRDAVEQCPLPVKGWGRESNWKKWNWYLGLTLTCVILCVKMQFERSHLYNQGRGRVEIQEQKAAEWTEGELKK